MLNPLSRSNTRLASPRALAALALAATALLGAGWVAPARPITAATSPTFSVTYDCLARPSDLRELGFSIRGKIDDVVVKPGQSVKKGQLLVRLDDAVQQRVAEAARIQAADDTTVRLAEAQVRYREQELALLTKARASDAGNDAQLREATFRTETSRIELDAAKSRLALAQAALKREEAELEDMRMIAPIDGVILDVRKREGETVEESTQVLAIICVDPIWIDVSVPIRDAAALSVGQSAEVIWDDIDDKTPMFGKVIYKAPAGNAGARQLQLRVELPNPKKLPSGMHGKIKFQLPSDGTVAPK